MGTYDPTVLKAKADSSANHSILVSEDNTEVVEELRRIRKVLKRILRLLMHEIMLEERWQQTQTSVLFGDTSFQSSYLRRKRRKKNWWWE